MDIYREKLLDHYQNPRNEGKIEDADAIMELENVSCGDKVRVYLKFDGEKLVKAGFEGEGCAIAIASTSILLEEILNKSKQQITKINLDRLLQLLGVQLTPSRMKCASLSLETVQKALAKH